MSEETKKRLARRFFEEILNKTDMALAAEILAPEFVMYYPTVPEPLHGVAGLEQVHVTFTRAFPDWRFKVEDEVAEGEKVAVRWSGGGTHTGDLMGIAPTGKRVTLTGMSIFRLAGGKILEDRVEANVMRMMQQLGVIP